MNELSIDKIQNSEIGEVADMLTEAFKTNPVYSIIFKKEGQLESGLSWLFRTNLVLLNHKCSLTHVVKDKNTGKIIGTFTLIPPQGTKNSLSIYAKIGLPRFILKFGIAPLVRMLQLDDINKKILKQSIKTPYYYLSMVVIRKEYRGTGVGTRVLKSTIEKLVASNPVCNMLGLTTQLPENVTFYSRLGFGKLEEGIISYKGDEYYNWNMKLDLL